MPENISCICTVSLHYRFFLQKVNWNIFQYSLGTTQFWTILAFIWFLSFCFFILKQQILCVLILQGKCLPAFVRFLFSIDSSCRKKFEYSAIFFMDYTILGNPCIYMVSIRCEILLIYLMSILHFQKDLIIFQIDSFMGSQEDTRFSTFFAFLWLVSCINLHDLQNQF